MSIACLLFVLVIAVLNFFVGAVLGRQWLLDDLDELHRQELLVRLRRLRRIRDRRPVGNVSDGEGAE